MSHKYKIKFIFRKIKKAKNKLTKGQTCELDRMSHKYESFK